MISATVSSCSYFCWLNRVSPSLAAKNIISLILVLKIWWCPCVESSLVVLKDYVCYDQCVLLKWSEVAQLCLTLCYPMDCSLLGPSIHGIFQARVLEWFVISFSRGSSQPRDRTQVSCIVGRHFSVWATREAKLYYPLPCFILHFKAKLACYSRYLLTSYFCIPVPYNEKDIFFGC